MADMLMTMKRRAQNLQTVQNLPTTFNQIIGEVVSIPAGPAGELVQTRVDVAPILDADAIWYGGAGNSSLSITSTAFTSEVPARSDEGLANGQYWVDYISGLIRGRKADASVSLLANYKTRILKIGAVTITGPVEIDSPIDVNVLTLPSLNVASLPPITFASPQSVNVSNVVHAIIDSMPSVTISGTPTVNIGTMPSVTISGSSIVVGNVAAGVMDSGNPVKMGGVYNYAKPNLLNGQRGDLQLETDGSLRVKVTERPLAEDNDLLYSVLATKGKPVTGTKYTYAIDRSVALENFTISAASNTPVNWRMTRWMIDRTMPSGEYFWQTGDYLSLPPDGAVTLVCDPLKLVHYNGIDTYFNIDNLDNCIPLTGGLISWLSTTRFSKTLASGSFGHGTIYYKT